MSNSRQVIIWLVILLSGLCLKAQDRAPKADYVFDGDEIAGFQWLVDGSGLKIFDNVDASKQRIELEYSLQTQQTQSASDVELRQSLETLNTTTAESETEKNLSSIFYVSPNERWVAYAVPENGGYSLAVYQFDTGQTHILSEATIMLPHDAYRFSIKWSDNSSAFYVRNRNGPVTYWYYVYGFDQSLEEAQVVILHDRRRPFQSAVVGFREVFDIGLAGDFLLIEQDSRIDNKAGVKLTIVNMSDYSIISLVDTHNIKAASFGNEDEIFYIDDEGMFVYDLETSMLHLLNASINSSWIQDVEISPDGHYIAATEGGDTDSLYIIPTGLKK